MRQYKENGYLITEYDSGTIAKSLIFDIPKINEELIRNEPTSEEIQTQILLNTEYLVIMSEITTV